MSKQVFAFCITMLVLSGCLNENVPMPTITDDYKGTVVLPRVSNATSSRPKTYTNVPRSWLPTARVERRWRAIIIHHSLTNKGNATVFDNYHRNDHKWKGVGYNFVIGNGNGSGDGEVEVTFRWYDQITGAHCGGTPGNWANREGIGICLVGDFSRSAPSYRQMQSLVQLIRFLQQRYTIPKSKIYDHRSTPGYTSGSNCPGNFPMARLKSMLDF